MVSYVHLIANNLSRSVEANSCAVKLADFGNAMFLQQASRYFEEFNVQTLWYRSPEVLLNVPFGVEIDMWSLGCVLFEACDLTR